MLMALMHLLHFSFFKLLLLNAFKLWETTSVVKVRMRMSFWWLNCLLCALASIYNKVLDKSIVEVSSESKETHKGLFTVPVLTLHKIGTKFSVSLQMFFTPDSCVEMCLTKDLPY